MIFGWGEFTIELVKDENAAEVIQKMPQYRGPEGLALISKEAQHHPHGPTGQESLKLKVKERKNKSAHDDDIEGRHPLE